MSGGVTRIASATDSAIGELLLRPWLDEGLRSARRRGVSTLVSCVLPLPPRDPVDVFERAAAVAADRFLWLQPEMGCAMVGVGAAWSLVVVGERRFAEANAAWRERSVDALVRGEPGVVGTGPLLLGGFAFDPFRPATPLWEGFPDGLLVLPRYLVTRSGDTAWLTVNVVLEPDGDPALVARSVVGQCRSLLARGVGGEGAADGSRVSWREAIDPHGGPRRDHVFPAARGQVRVEEVPSSSAWQSLVGSLARDLQRGAAEKAVLARRCRAVAQSPIRPAAILRQLAREYPGCFVFAVARGDRCFLGASPERLVRLRDGVVQTTCLAGSAARGATPEEDRQLGKALQASAKDRAEHAVVVRALREALAEACVELSVAEEPGLLKMRNVQHLHTPVVGRCRPGHTVLDLVQRLHPTPAVGGYPRDAALRLIREREGLDRGWYSGPVGWVDAAGEGEFAVAIRSALLRGCEAWLFAGCGVVADSDPRREYDESRLKLRPMLAALGVEEP
ncbi:MAG TPA: isochorismate synthase [Chloroflexota bacterium]